MPSEPYLLRLTAVLADGLSRVPAATRSRHAAYLKAVQNADGGWSGREGESDLYYTGFALRSLAVLDELTPELCTRTAAFLRTSLTQQTSVVDFFSLLYSSLLIQTIGGPDVFADSPKDWPDRVAAMLETFRTPDGGYAKQTGAAAGSTYHTFLVGLCYELLNRSFPAPSEVGRFILSRRREDGGFVELAPMKRSGTNPTAAGLGTLQLLDNPEFLTDEVREGVADLLAEMPSDEGGLRANSRIPLADLLSTFTGCWTLRELGALDRIDSEEALGYALGMERDEGGFRGGLWDREADVEYTFYGLGVLGLFGRAEVTLPGTM